MREARLKPILGEFEAHFDTLREGLIEELTHYEGQLKKHANALPEWLALDFKIIWPLFQFDKSSIAPEGALGPRVVAVAAGWLEEHMFTWMGSHEEPTIIAFAQDEERITSYKNAHEEIGQELEQLLLLSETVAQQARGTLGQWRDDILAELEQQRVEDIEAIEKLVADGDLDPGRDARQEIALLWEDQRQMASTLLKKWEPFDELVSQGLEVVRNGIEHLQEILAEIHEGMCEVYPQLDENYTGESIIPTSAKTDPFLSKTPEDPNVQPEHLLLIQPSTGKTQSKGGDGFEFDLDQGFDPYGESSDGEEDEDYHLPFEFDEDFDDTPILDDAPLPPLSLDIDEPGPTLPMMLDDSEMQDGPMIDFDQETPPELFLDIDDAQSPTEPPGEHFAMELELDDAHAPVPESSSTPSQPSMVLELDDEPEDDTPDDARVETLLTITADELRAPIDDEPEDAFDEPAEAPSMELDEPSSEPIEEDDAPHHAPPEEPTREPLVEEDDVEAPVPTTRPTPAVVGWHYDDSMVTLAKRAMEQVLPLNRGIFFLAFVLPLLLVIGTLVVSALSRVNPSIPNPLIPSPNVFHFVGIALLIWLCICPLTMRWQITWRGWRPRLWHRVHVREEADLALHREHLELGHWMMPWGDIEEYSLRRWEDLQTGMRGWILELTFERQNHLFSAVSKDDEEWKKTRAPLMPYAPQAWRVSEQTFHKLLEAFQLEI